MRFPPCPNCAKPMTFGRLIPGSAVFKPVTSFDCLECRVAVTEAVVEPGPGL